MACLQLGAEFVGTFILIFFATAAPIVNQKYGGAISPFGNAATAGLAVTTIILSTGHISGAHLNPSLTIAFAALRHFPWLQVPAYVSVQVLGSICASYALKGVFHPFLSGGVTVPDVTISTAQAFFTEFIITFNLLFVVTAVATDTRAVRRRSVHILFAPCSCSASSGSSRIQLAVISSCCCMQVGELAGIAVGAAVTLNILVAG